MLVLGHSCCSAAFCENCCRHFKSQCRKAHLECPDASSIRMTPP
jgi:hypothetical protein